jgi:MFS-type transporter involved in bile tolerance (Atg22 family)
VIWGIGMGAQESIMKAAVSKIIPSDMRSTGFGIFETGFGIFWFLGSWCMGTLYDLNINVMVCMSVLVQLLEIAFYWLAIIKK